MDQKPSINATITNSGVYGPGHANCLHSENSGRHAHSFSPVGSSKCKPRRV